MTDRDDASTSTAGAHRNRWSGVASLEGLRRLMGDGRPLRFAGHFMMVILYVSATSDLLRRFEIGPWSLLTWVTLLAFLLTLMLGRVLVFTKPAPPRAVLTIATSFLILGGITGISLIAFGFNRDGLHFLLVNGLFASLFVLAASSAHRLEHRATQLFDVAGKTVWITSLLFAGAWLFTGGNLMGPRSIAMFLLVPYSVHLARWKVYGLRHGWPALVALGVIGLTLSRGALFAAVVIIPFAFLSTLRFSEVVRAARVTSIGIVSLIAGIVLYEPLRTRFFSGDLSLVLGGIAINAEGRTALWNAVFTSFLEAPIFGQGAGSAMTQATFDVVDFVSHPHNEYLRMAHDFGVVGLAVFITALGLLFVRLQRLAFRARRTALQQDEFISAAAKNLLMCFIVIMLTDNPLHYAFFMAPLAILTGLAARGRPEEAQVTSTVVQESQAPTPRS